MYYYINIMNNNTVHEFKCLYIITIITKMKIFAKVIAIGNPIPLINIFWPELIDRQNLIDIKDQAILA